MAKVKLDIEYNTEPIQTAFAKGDELLEKQRVSIAQLSKDTKTAFAAGATEADKFAKEVTDGTKQVAMMDAATKNLNKVFNDANAPQSVEEKKIALVELEKQLNALIKTEQKLIEQQNIAGPSNIKEQFDKPIADVKQDIDSLKGKIKDLNNIKISPQAVKIDTKIDEVKNKITNAKADNKSTQEPGQIGNTNININDIKSLEKELKKLEEEKKRLEDDKKPLVPPQDKAVNEIKKIRQEIKNLLSEAVRLQREGDLLGAEEAIKKAGELKDELGDLQSAVKAVSGNAKENLAGAFGQATELIAKGFEAVVAAQSLVGVENEDIQKQLLKLQAVQSITRLAGEFADLKDRLNEIKISLTPVTNLYARANESVKKFFTDSATRANVLGRGNKNLFESLSEGVSSFAKKGVESFKSFWATIAANPLGVILVAIGAFAAAIVTLRDKIKPFGAIFEFFSDAVEHLMRDLEKLGQFFGIVASENEKANKKIIASTEEVIEAINRQYNAEIALAEARNKNVLYLEDERTLALRHALQERLQAFKELEKENKKLDEEQVKRREEIIKQLEDIELAFSVRLIKQQRERREFLYQQDREAAEIRLNNIKDDQTREEALLKNSYENRIEDLKKSFDEQDEFIVGEEKQQYEFFKKSQARLKAEEEKYLADLQRIREKYLEKRREQLKRLLELELAFRKQLLDITNRALMAEARTEEERIEVDKKIALEQLQALRESLIKQGQEVENFQAEIEHRKARTFKLNEEQEKQFSILQQRIFQDATERLIKLEIERQTKINAARSATAKAEETNLDLEEANMIADIKLAPMSDFSNKEISEVDLERQKQQAVLTVQQEFAFKRARLQKNSLDAQFDAESAALYSKLELLQENNDEWSKLEEDQINKDLYLLETKYKLERAKIDDELSALIESIKAKRKELDEENAFDLAKFLGLTPAQLDQLKQGIDTLNTVVEEVANAFSSLNELQQKRLEKEIEQSEQRRQENEKDISDLSDRLKTEQDLALQGKANNAELVRQQLEEKEAAAQRDNEIAQEQLEKKKALQKQQLTIDTITQTSGLITASANILATTAKDPITLALALTAISAMIAGFAVAKVNAYKAVNEGLNLKDGDIDIKGPGTETSDSIPANLSRGESVMTAKETREHKDTLLAIRNKNPLKLAESALKFLLKGTGVIMPRDIVQTISDKKSEAKNAEVKLTINNHVAELQKEQQITNSKLDALIAAQKNTVLSHGDNLVFKSGSHIKIQRQSRG